MFLPSSNRGTAFPVQSRRPLVGLACVSSTKAPKDLPESVERSIAMRVSQVSHGSWWLGPRASASASTTSPCGDTARDDAGRRVALVCGVVSLAAGMTSNAGMRNML